MATLFSRLFHYVMLISSKHGIDESHGLKHSMDVLHYTQSIYNFEVLKHPILQNHERIAYVSAVVHDMCDKKYMSESEGIRDIHQYLESDLTENELSIIKKIISTMSYSTVKKNGFPFMGPYQYVYDVVREADLLAAYDFDRCMMYKMHLYGLNKELDMMDVFKDAEHLFENRVFKHDEHGLFHTEFAKEHSIQLQTQALIRMESWKTLLHNTRFRTR